MPRILITGASGMLGAAAINFFHDKDWEIYALTRTNKIAFPEKCVSVHYGRIENEEELSVIVKGIPQLDLIIHGAALTNLETCEADFKAAINVNTIGTLNLINSLKGTGTYPEKKPLFVYISSDAVYPDIEGRKPEKVAVAPASKYGVTKLWGETVTLKEWPNSLVLRTTIVGNAPRQFAGWVLSAARSNSRLKLFTDVIFSPLFVTDLCRLIADAHARGLTGRFNAGSSDPISKADFAIRLLKRASLTPSYELTSLRQEPCKAPRSLNMALDSSKLFAALKIEPISANETISKIDIEI